MALKNLNLYKQEDVPDNLIEEIKKLTLEIGKILTPLLGPKDPNLVLMAMNWTHSAIISQLVDKEELEKAFEYCAISMKENCIKIKKVRDEEV